MDEPPAVNEVPPLRSAAQQWPGTCHRSPAALWEFNIATEDYVFSR